ncbi:MAG: hypothetical protein Q9201_004656 [Fulgogasparrea decipioides]
MGQLGDLSPQGSVAVGIFVGLASTLIQSLGLTLQRKSHILEDEKEPHHPRRPPFRRRRWQLGMLMFIVSNVVGSSIQITTLPLPVLSTLQASGLVFNSICATLILGEPFTRWSLGGTLLVCTGAVLIATFGAIGEPAHSLDQLLALLGRRQFLLWMAATAVVVVAVIIAAKAVRWMNPRTNHSPRLRLLRGMAYGSISGILSAHSLLVAKSAVELLVRTIITLGTVILLIGVLALSWRLQDPSSTRPSVPHTPLTPGMGFVDSESGSEADETSLLTNTDEEAPRSSSNGKVPSPLVKTPTTRNNELLNATKRRRKSMTETQELLEELEDDTLAELYSPALSHHRRSSARSTPSKTVGFRADDAEQPDESTALLGRTRTGRSYRDRRTRRRSEPSRGGSQRRRGSRTGSQEALGGWWKMRWWRGSGGKRKERDDGRLDGGGES